MGERTKPSNFERGSDRNRVPANGHIWTWYLMAAAAAVLITSVTVLIAAAEKRERDVLVRISLLTHVEDAEHVLRSVHHALRTRQPVAHVPFLLREYKRDFEIVDDGVRNVAAVNREVRTRLEEAKKRNASFVEAAEAMGHEITPLSRAQALDATDHALAAVNDLNAALAKQFRSPFKHLLWRGMYAVVALSACLLVFLTTTQGRILRLQRHLFADLHALTQSTPQVLLSIDAEGNPLRWDERLTRAAGIDGDALRRGRINDLFDPSDAPSVRHAIDQALSVGSFECEVPLRTTEGSTDYAWLFSRNGDDDESELTVSGRDISDRRIAEKRLAATEAHYNDLFERMRDGVFISDEAGFVEVNSALATMFGRTREEVLALGPAGLYRSAEEFAALSSAIEREGGVTAYPVELLHRDGSILHCMVTASARMDEQGRLFGSQGVIRDVSEQRRLEESLKRSEADYRGLFEHAHDAIMILDPVHEVVLDANLRACMLYDFPYGELVGKSMEQLSVNVSRGKEYLHSTLSGSGKYLPFESSQYRRDGSVIEIDIHAAHVTYRGRPAILTINRDVTARKREERRVRESEERLRLLLESVVDYAIVMLDPAGTIVSWNEGAERLFDIPGERALGQSFSIFYPHDERQAGIPAGHLAEADANGRIEVEATQIRGDGAIFKACIVLTRVHDETGRLRGFALVTRDVTEKCRIEAAQKELFATIANIATEWTRTFDAVGAPILLIDENGRMRRLNEAAARLAGRDVKTMINHRPDEYPGEPWKTISSCADFYFERGVTIEGRAQDKPGGRVWSVTLAADDLAEERRVIVIVHDLTLVTRLEESLRRTQMTAALGTLVAGVAHEVRNPLFTISATLDTCEARLAASIPELEHFTTPLREEVNRLNRLMQELLDYGKPHPLQRADVSLVDVVRAAVAHNHASGQRSPIEMDLQCDHPIVNGDDGRLQQVIRNLIENSIQNGPPNQPVQVRLRSDGEYVVCEVLDRGRGFSADDLQRAFTPFYTRRKGGTGLGLAIVQNIITAHQGEIVLRNREGGGAVVSIRIPASTTPVASSPALR